MTVGIDGLELPIVLAPMAGGPSTPALAIAVSEAGGLGFLAAGYRTAADVREEVEAVRSHTRRPFGVNVFARPTQRGSDEEVRAYARSLESEAARGGVKVGEPRFDDDDYDAKLALLRAAPVAVASFTFGCPTHREAIEGSSATALTRAFTGRLARGIVNRFMLEHNAAAPRAYPEVNHMTSPIRAAARAAGDADAFNLWAGQAHALATRAPAGELIVQLAADAREALERARLA
jgi:NAD(P)H-dependent flavin oxidoreductase YrpB (nitropropane dioxygenase family)